jgi:ubiquinone/menaquinone biosynthesis C-methylase UbiE
MATFDERAAEWDTPERVERAHAVAEVIRRHVRLRPSMRMVELGAGTGLLGLDLAGDVASIVLTDPSPGMLDIARGKIAATGLPNVAVAVYDLPADPPPGAPFDVAVSMLALHHIEDTEAALRSICGMLVDGGWLALVDLDAEDGSFHTAEAEGIHHHGFDRAALARIASAAGFREVAVHGAGTADQGGRPYQLFLLAARR